MLMPKRVKRRKQFRGTMAGKAMRGNTISNGEYGFAEADTTYGKVGVKVWIYKGEVLPTKSNKEGSDK